MTIASAPGKIILFGEHAVVYGRPALAVPVTQIQARVTVCADQLRGIRVEAPDISLDAVLSELPPNHPLAAVIKSVFTTLGITQPPSLTVHIESTIPVASSLGSGAAVSVAIIRALSMFLGCPLADEQVNALAFEVEKLYHGTPSGIDNTVITYARPVYFAKHQPIETLHVAAPFIIVIGDTGIASPTKQVVDDVRKLWQAETEQYEKIFNAVGEIVLNARHAIENGNISALGPLMDENNSMLQVMRVSSPELDRLITASRAAGALGAKLSGGGRGGNMIALVRQETVEKVTQALREAGAKRTLMTVVK